MWQNEDQIDLTGQNSSTSDAKDSLIHTAASDTTSEFILLAVLPEHRYLNLPKTPLEPIVDAAAVIEARNESTAEALFPPFPFYSIPLNFLLFPSYSIIKYLFRVFKLFDFSFCLYIKWKKQAVSYKYTQT